MTLIQELICVFLHSNDDWKAFKINKDKWVVRCISCYKGGYDDIS